MVQMVSVTNIKSVETVGPSIVLFRLYLRSSLLSRLS
jgi:hypothetical protein